LIYYSNGPDDGALSIYDAVLGCFVLLVFGWFRAAIFLNDKAIQEASDAHPM